MQVQKESWVLPDGTRVQKICHTIGRCRKSTFPHVLNVLPDIVEIRCNIEVHEQSQDVQDPMLVSFDNGIGGVDKSNSDSSLYAVSSSSVKLYSDMDTEYHFSRFAGSHVEIHYNFVEEDMYDNVCRPAPFLPFRIPEDRSVCRAAVTVVHNNAR